MRAVQHLRKSVKLLAFAALAGVLTTSVEASSQTTTPSTNVCVDAYGKAQEHRMNNDLLKARDALWTCARTTCPSVIQNDCTTWLNQVIESIPSIVLEAKVDDDSVFDVTVSMDGARIATQLDGKPIEINPGLHTFVFERSGGTEPIEKKIIIAAHMKSQIVSVGWHLPASARKGEKGSGAAGATAKPIPPLVYVLGGVSVAAFATFAVLGLTGQATQHDLENSCQPKCSTSDVSSLKARFIGADVAAGVSALAAAGAVTLYLTRPEHGEPPAPGVSALRVAPVSGGAMLSCSGSF
jgi:hypothetical protein